MPGDEAQRLAKVAAVTDDLDRILDKLFENVAELKKTILARTEPPAPGSTREPL